MPLPIFSLGQSPARSAQQLFAAVLLLGGLLVILLGLVTFASKAESLNVKIIAIVCAAGVFIASLCLMVGSANAPPASRLSAPSTEESEEIEVDRKLSKKSVSTIASSTGSVVIHHAPSNSLERVVVYGDVEQALPDARS
jgi:hypothetical protein